MKARIIQIIKKRLKIQYNEETHEMLLTDEGWYNHIESAIALVNSLNRSPGARYICVDEKGRIYGLDKDFGKPSETVLV